MTDKKMTMQGLGEIALGILFLILIFGIAPLIGSSLETTASIVQGSAATGTLTITGNVTCGQFVNLTFPDTTFVRYQANFTTPQAGCSLNTPGVIAWPLNPSATGGNSSTNATYALFVALGDDDSGNISGRLVVTNPSAGVITVTYATKGTVGNGVITTDTVPGGWAAGTLLGGIDVSAWGDDNIPTGYDFWAIVAPFLTLAAIILIVAGFLTTLKGLKNNENSMT